MRLSLNVPLVVLVGMLACGLPLWPIPYREVSMPGNPSPATWLCLGSLAGVFAGYRMRPGFPGPAFAVAAGFVLAVLARVAVETAADPTTHNLWPFEVAIAGFFGVVAGFLGVGVARGAQKVTGSRSSFTPPVLRPPDDRAG